MTWLQIYLSGAITTGLMLFPKALVACLHSDDPFRAQVGRFAWALGVSQLWPVYLFALVTDWLRENE